MENEKLLTASEISEITNYSIPQIHAWKKEGLWSVQEKRKGRKVCYVFKLSLVEQFIEDKRNKAK